MKRIAAIGTFDGMHRGHQWLLGQLKEIAASEGLEPMAVTFDRHPLATIAPNKVPACLSTTADRIAALEAEVGKVAVIEFDEKMRCLTAKEFMQYLRDKFNVEAIYLGYNHKFGSDRMQDISGYKQAASELGMRVLQGEEAQCQGAKVSSSQVRVLLGAGKVEEANELLGHSYKIEGTVVEGRQVGRKLGFPTANLQTDCDCQLIPYRGVYACQAQLADGATYNAVVNIGVRPTFSDTDPRPTIEAHLIGFGGDLYCRKLSLYFLRRLRDEKKFKSTQELTEQIRRDIQSAG